MRLDTAPVHVARISPATWGALATLILLLGALSLFIIGCDHVFKVTLPPCEPGQISDACAGRRANYYTCECSCKTADPSAFSVGAQIRVTLDVLNVRDNPAGNVLGQQVAGADGAIVAGPVAADLDGDGIPETWWQVDFGTDPDGWVIETALEVVQTLKDLKTCLPPELNPNVQGGRIPDPDDIVSDCSDRVAAHFGDITGQEIPSGTTCSCAAIDTPSLWDSSCDASCDDPGNVCLVSKSDPAQPTPEPLSTALFQPTSLCEVTGTADIQVGTELKHTSVQGVMQIHGRPCASGQTCQVGISYQLTLGDIEIEVAFHENPKFVDMAVSGASEANAIALAPFLPLFPTLYVGDVATGATLNSARVRREGSDAIVLVGRNGAPLGFGVDWVNKICVLDGEFISSAESGVVDDDGNQQPLHLRLSLGGPTSNLVNQPPHANAGADQTVECTSPQGALVTLSGAGSTDADGNIAFYSWRSGSETGPKVGDPSTNPARTVQQAIGETTYHLRVVDRLFAADSASVKVKVADTTAPVISCNAPATITPPDRPITFTPTATDTCGPAPVVAIDNVQCLKTTGSGRVVDDQSCKVESRGDQVTINAGGVDNVIQFRARATDAAGNVGEQLCEVLVANPGGGR